MEPRRVVELYVPGRSGAGSVGSGYRLGREWVLTAGHVVADLPVRSPAEPVPVDLDAPGVCRAGPLGEPGWVSAALVWRDVAADVALLRVAAAAPDLPAGVPAVRWGRVSGTEPVAVSAVGFPRAQQQPDRMRETEQLFGFLAPATTVKSGTIAISVLSGGPAAGADGMGWKGMSGAALFAGPFLVGVLTTVPNPLQLGADRLVAVPIDGVLASDGFAAVVGIVPADLVEVGARLRLAVTREVSVAVAPPYRAATARLGGSRPGCCCRSTASCRSPAASRT